MNKKGTRKQIQTPFARNLTCILKERNVSQRNAAELAGVEPSVVNSWMSGSVPHDLNAVYNLAKALDCDFQWLLTDIHSKATAPEVPLSEIFEIEDHDGFSGLFLIQAKRLKRK